VESDCKDLAREDEFNDWYNNIHIPDVMETQGFISATRYEIIQSTDEKGKYLAIYEMETDDFDQLMSSHQENMNRKEARGRISELISVTSRGIYKKID